LVIKTGGRGGTAGFGLGFSWRDYVLTQFGAIVRYLRLAIWPHPLDFDYTARWVGRPLEAVPAAAVVAALAAATAYAFLRPARRDACPPLAAQQNGGESQAFGVRALGFAGVWFFAILAPTSLVPGLTQTIAEHRMYLALAPIMAAVILGADATLQACRAKAWRRRTIPVYLVPVTALAVALAFAGLTSFRNRDYRSAMALWGDTARKSPDNPYAQNNFGIALIDAGRLAEAAVCFEQTVRLKPDYAEAYNNLGLVVAGLGRLSEAIADYGRALRLKPNYPEAHANLGVALASTGRNDEAILHFQEALRLKPDYADARNNFAVALAGTGRLKEAITQYEAVLQTGSAHAETYYNLGNALAMTGRLPEAIAQYEAAVRLKPDYVEAQANLGAVLAQTGRPAEAIIHYQEALRLDPKDADVHFNLGLALRSVGRLREAQAQFEEAARLKGGH
jgi:tetratricopeptide (TPR) repeat protein